MDNLTAELLALWPRFVEFLPRLGAGLAVLFVGWLASRWLVGIVGRGLARRKADRELTVLLQLLTRWGTLALALVLALEQVAPGRFGGLIAGLGVAGFTLGFALQDVAKNFVAGVLLLLQQPFQIGDAIEVAGHSGEVLDISLRTTELRTFDGRNVLIPNADVFTRPIVNFTRAPRRRLEWTLRVAAEADLDRAVRAALEALRGVPGVLADPAPQVAFRAFEPGGLGLTAHCWVEAAAVDLLEAEHQGVRRLKAAFDEAGVKIL